jgi:hypothetical protein
MTQRSRSPAPNSGKRDGAVTPAPKVAPLPARIFIPFKTPANGVCKFHNYYAHKAHRYGALCLVGKLACRQTTFGSAANSTHATATAMHFPPNAGLIFLMDGLTNDRYLVYTGATLCIVPCNQNSSLSGPLLKGADWQPIPSWGFIKKTVQFQGKLFTSSFFASHCGWSHSV